MEDRKTETSVMDIWTESTKDYWSKLFELQSLNGNNGNGSMKQVQKTMKSCMNIWKSFATLVTDPATLATLPKAAAETPAICLKMQQREMERFFHAQSDWMAKTEHYGKLSRLIYMKTFS
jgi:hypothetical protein